ncbi:NUDIX domain-containing protein [Croceibacterium aestuarii]|uniref:NUDIX domain-containing protein n=1 Tax=Croceibacterium aestuarii TaxID=3064139 RepID=UPI00272E2E2C|nr:NUDIX hydrolase [Croceibacterium sp. D39]
MWQGRFITAKRRGRWEYVGRARGIRAAVILAVDAGEVVLVEQFRVPLGKPCLELPAGLIGDDEGADDEDHFAAAERELEEETGFAAARWEDLGEYASSPGMVGETFSLLRASGLSRVGDGGGVEGENITVHKVPVAALPAFVAERRAAGTMIDVRLLLLLGAGMLTESDA